MTDDLDIPRADAAERAVLGSMMLSPNAIPPARSLLTLADFYTAAHETIYAVCCDLHDVGTRPDAVVVLDELQRRGDLARVGGATYLHTLMAAVPTATNVGYYAMQVRAAARRRQLVLTGRRIAQIGAEVADLDEALMAAARESIALTMVLDETIDAPIDGLSTWAEFLAQPDRIGDWIVPGLIERQDVVMVLATPGAGKSWLSRQIALCIAAGVHPFKPTERIEAQRTLLVDLENPPSMVRRQSRGLGHQVARLGEFREDFAHLWAQPGGINIRKHADAQLLERVIAETRPALVCLGSLYNAFERGRDDWDTAAEEAKAVFNRLRQRYGCAFWIEHHMPKGADSKKSPFGSSVWERWPGFGRVIDRKGQNVFAFEKTFRGDRDVREFPVGLSRGGDLPWCAIWDDEELAQLSSAGEGRIR